MPWRIRSLNSGAKGLSGNPNVPPRSFASSIASGYEKACPDTYSEKILKEGKNERGYDELVAVLSCGATAGASGVSSESALIVVIKGDRDYYTVQWA